MPDNESEEEELSENVLGDEQIVALGDEQIVETAALTERIVEPVALAEPLRERSRSTKKKSGKPRRRSPQSRTAEPRHRSRSAEPRRRSPQSWTAESRHRSRSAEPRRRSPQSRTASRYPRRSSSSSSSRSREGLNKRKLKKKIDAKDFNVFDGTSEKYGEWRLKSIAAFNRNGCALMYAQPCEVYSQLSQEIKDGCPKAADEANWLAAKVDVASVLTLMCAGRALEAMEAVCPALDDGPVMWSGLENKMQPQSGCGGRPNLGTHHRYQARQRRQRLRPRFSTSYVEPTTQASGSGPALHVGANAFAPSREPSARDDGPNYGARKYNIRPGGTCFEH